MSSDPKYILQSVFGHEDFRSRQREIIDNILEREDTLVVMPTGSGKSLCYQIPALVFEGITVVVSPLISLMQDQVEQLQENGVDAIYLNSSLDEETYRTNISRLMKGSVSLLYMAPETLLKDNILDLLQKISVDCITIDEAHCISEWGHDFRPEYRRLYQLREIFADAVFVALTATATPRVRQDIKQALSFEDSATFISSFDRDNLFLEVQPKSDPLKQTLEFLRKHENQPGIIYCFSRKQVDHLYRELADRGYSVLPYHAGYNEQTRERNQQSFVRGEVNIIAATIAFGMGIDKPDVRFVLHYDLPKSVEAYYQQIGRAGRDGNLSHCLMLFNYSDIRKIKFIIENKPDEQQRKVANLHLTRLLQYAETNECRRLSLLRYFGESYQYDNCDNCDNCRHTKEGGEDLTIPAQKFLSCAIRTDQLFGAKHLIDVLKGNNNKKIRRHDHDKLPVYGIGEEFTRDLWWKLFRLLQQRGYLRRDPEYGSLIVDAKAKPLLKGERSFKGELVEHRGQRPGQPNPDFEYEEELFKKLRQKRNDMAREMDAPPYVICSNRTLKEMAAKFPDTRETMMEIYGMGPEKVDHYGQTFLDIIQRHFN